MTINRCCDCERCKKYDGPRLDFTTSNTWYCSLPKYAVMGNVGMGDGELIIKYDIIYNGDVRLPRCSLNKYGKSI